MNLADLEHDHPWHDYLILHGKLKGLLAGFDWSLPAKDVHAYLTEVRETTEKFFKAAEDLRNSIRKEIHH